MLTYLIMNSTSGEDFYGKHKNRFFFNKDHEIIAMRYDFSASYYDNINIMYRQFIEIVLTGNRDICICGEGLGAFYARVLAEMFDLKCWLVNPITNPYEELNGEVSVMVLNTYRHANTRPDLSIDTTVFSSTPDKEDAYKDCFGEKVKITSLD